jgi:biopolymer transport protein ExbB
MVGDTLDTLQLFFDRGGPALWAILAVSLWLWLRIAEGALLLLRSRRDTASTGAHNAALAHGLRPIVAEAEALVAVLPLLGLLGTIGGMIEAFDVLAYSGSTSGSTSGSPSGNSDARGLSLGISRALLTTMAGLVTSLAGLFAAMPLSRRLARASLLSEESEPRSAFAITPLLSLRSRLSSRAGLSSGSRLSSRSRLSGRSGREILP